MYHLYNMDRQTEKRIFKHKLFETLTELEDQGAKFSLEIDGQIIYSFKDMGQSESIEEIVQNATYY